MVLNYAQLCFQEKVTDERNALARMVQKLRREISKVCLCTFTAYSFKSILLQHMQIAIYWIKDLIPIHDVRRFLLEKCDVNMVKNKNLHFMVSNLSTIMKHINLIDYADKFFLTAQTYSKTISSFFFCVFLVRNV